MPDIYQYLDYRDYLHDYYKEKKEKVPTFSYQVFANKAGFKSRSFLSDVIEGRKNLSENSLFSIGKALNLPELEFLYFKNLVFFNQAKNHRQKDHFFKCLTESNQAVVAKLVLSNQYEYYSHWYHSTIRELVTIVDFKEDYALLARCLRPAISPRMARQSVDLLLRLGLIIKKEDRYEQVDTDITTGDTVCSLAIENFHLQNLNLAGESLDSFGAHERDISCIVSSMSRSRFTQVKKEISLFRSKLIAMINMPDQHGTEKKRVYHLNMQLFPTTHDDLEVKHDE